MAVYLTQRFYEEKLPKVNEIVITKVTRLDQMGVYCKLVEYGDIEGYIPTPELSQVRVRKINHITKIGKQEIAVVLRVDKEKGYIDLSKRKVENHELQKANDRYTKSKVVNAILNTIHTDKGINVSELYEKIAWPLARTYGSAYDAFKKALPNKVEIFKDLNIDQSIIDLLMENIRRRLNPQKQKLYAEIELTCDEPAGVNAIREALLKGEEASNEFPDIKIECKVKATPYYTIETITDEKDKGLKIVGAAITLIKNCIEEHGGKLEVKQEPSVLSNRQNHVDSEEELDEMDEDDDDLEDEDEEEEERSGDD